MMPSPLPGSCSIFRCQLDGDWQHPMQPDAYLNEREKGTIRRLHSSLLQRRASRARALLRALLGEIRGERAKTVPIETSPTGKPFCPGGPAFNVAHSGERLIVAISEHLQSVGIDIEIIEPLPDLAAVAAQVFSHRESRQFAGLEPTERLSAFYHGWTRKEALLKALGQGLSLPMPHISVDLRANSGNVFLECRLRGVKKAQWFILPVGSRSDEAISLALPAHAGRLRALQERGLPEG